MNRGSLTPRGPLLPSLKKVKFFIYRAILMKFETQHFHMFNPLMPIIIVQHFYEFYTSKQFSRIHLTHRVTQIKILLINTENMAW